MTTDRRSRKTSSRAGYFDCFWGCPGCRRILSIAEIIELHCEDCDLAIEPLEIVIGEPANETPDLERLS
ncbi:MULTISPECIES: hypothetical protein [unclassified Rhizobium]|uniref:hypothetical protein n=1 Tax=unclassified Rhizobium TaxID=2613769 RepID=UPI000EA9D72D|nr:MULTISPECIES: hypothetical protein [unclassified Rhizobium]AYG66776.1 hypothetical protein CCGE531_12770 [Rhizobium sp. CCGE531]AYG73156.1 hypothetical protein CCGE532_12190 [Rhizobium sp. CCGE532]